MFKTTEQQRERSRKYYAANIDKCREKSRKYYAANTDKCREKCRKYYYAHLEQRREKIREYYAANIDKCREKIRKYYHSHPEKVRKRRETEKLKFYARAMVDADFYADYRRKQRARHAKYRRKKGMKCRGPQPARTIPDWCVMGGALDTRSRFLFVNAAPEMKDYAMRLALERMGEE